MSRRKGRRGWFGSYVDETGRRHQVSLAEDFHDAKRIFDRIKDRVALKKHGADEDLSKRTWIREVADDYLEDLSTRSSPGHVENVDRSIDAVLRVLPVRFVEALTVGDVLKARTALSEPDENGWTPSHRTLNFKVGTLVTCLRWAEETGRIARNPVPRIRKLSQSEKHQRRKRRRLEVRELAALIEAARQHDGARSRRSRIPQAPMLEVVAATGIRWREASTLEWQDWLQGRAIRIRSENAKTEKTREIAINADTDAALSALRQAQADKLDGWPTAKDRVFLTPSGLTWEPDINQRNSRRWLEEVRRLAKLPKVWPDGRRLDWHSLRHTFITDLDAAGVDLGRRQAMAGHSTPAMTQSYTDTNRRAGGAEIEKLNQYRKGEA